MKTKYLILGSGIGGLAAGARLKEIGEHNFAIIDKCDSLPLNLHNGVHYLHSNDFGTPFPFELKKIQATEEIWDPRTDNFRKISHIPEMLEYSMKIMGLRHPSSIMDPGNRNWDTYLPMSNNMNDLLSGYYNYIGSHFLWGRRLRRIDAEKKEVYVGLGDNEVPEVVEYEHLISTIPLPTLYKSCYFVSENEFKNAPVHITNYKTDKIVGNWLIGIYISDPKFPPHRLTILNNIISMESIKPMTYEDEVIVKYHLERYFDYSLKTKESYTWDTGRIWGLTKEEREKVVNSFRKNNIHLVGRFARWDGKLLMDSTILQAKSVIDSI